LGCPPPLHRTEGEGPLGPARCLARHGMFVAIHKHYSLGEWEAFLRAHPDCIPHLAPAGPLPLSPPPPLPFVAHAHTVLGEWEGVGVVWGYGRRASPWDRPAAGLARRTL